MANPIRVSQEVAYANAYRKVYNNTFQNECGEQGGFIIDRSTSQNPDGVDILGITAAWEYIVIKEFFYGNEQTTLTVAGGTIDNGETPEQAAAREFLEETGYQVGQLKYVGKVANGKYSTGYGLLYIATDCVWTKEPHLEAFESIEVLTLSKDQLQEAIKTSPDISGWLLSALYMNSIL